MNQSPWLAVAEFASNFGQENGKWCIGALKQTAPCPSGPDCNGGPPVDCEAGTSETWICQTRSVIVS